MKKKMNQIKILKFIVFLAVIGIIIYNIIYLFPIIKDIATPEGRELFRERITSSGAKGILMLFLLQIAQIFLVIIPGEPLEILAGMCYGTTGGTVFLLITVFITTTIIFYMVRKFGRGLVYEFFERKKVDKIRKNKTFNNPKKIENILFVLFFIPGTPKDLLVYIGGLLPIKPSKFILISTFARLPSIISSTLAGSNIVKGNFTSIALIYGITFALVGLVFLIINFFDKDKDTVKVLDEINNYKTDN